MRYMSQLASLIFRPSLFTWSLAIFTTLIGFYITNVVEDLRSGATAVYYFDFDRKSGLTRFHLVNASRKIKIDAADFVIKCIDQRADCFQPLPNSGEKYVSEITSAPNFSRPIKSGKSAAGAIQVCLGAIASSRTSISFLTSEGKRSKIMALYDAWSSDCKSENQEAQNLLLLKSTDPHAFFVQHYFDIISYLLLFSTIIIVLTGIGVAIRELRGQKEVANEPHDSFVVISYRSGGSSNRKGGG
jgi:hypothetical protein